MFLSYHEILIDHNEMRRAVLRVREGRAKQATYRVGHKFSTACGVVKYWETWEEVA